MHHNASDPALFRCWRHHNPRIPRALPGLHHRRLIEVRNSEWGDPLSADCWLFVLALSGNTKMPSYQYRKFHCGDKMVVRSSYLHNGISYTGKTASLYWFNPLVCFDPLIGSWYMNYTAGQLFGLLFKCYKLLTCAGHLKSMRASVSGLVASCVKPCGSVNNNSELISNFVWISSTPKGISQCLMKLSRKGNLLWTVDKSADPGDFHRFCECISLINIVTPILNTNNPDGSLSLANSDRTICTGLNEII